MTRFFDLICKTIEYLIAAFMAGMVVLVFGNVLLRYGFNSGITLSEELSRWLFVWLTFLGAVIAMAEGSHLGSDMLVSRLGVTGKKVCLVLGHLLMLWACWLLGTGAFELARINVESLSPVMEVPQSIFFSGGVVFAVSSAAVTVLRRPLML